MKNYSHSSPFVLLALLPCAVAAADPALPDWENPAVNSRNRLPPRAYAAPLVNAAAAFTDELEFPSPYVRSLNGNWRFAWAGNPDLVEKGFWKPGFDDSDWFTIDVPSCVEMRGFGSPGYTNVRYPHRMSGSRILDRQSGKADYNPVSSYRTTFAVPESWKDREVILRFDGVYSAYYVWVNGHPVGYAEDSKLPSEFDVTPYLNPVGGPDNVLAVEVFRWCDGSYLEDQDMFRFSGIFRDVTLWAKPKDGIWDFAVKTSPTDGTYRNWRLELTVETPSGWKATVYDADRREVARLAKDRPAVDLADVRAWSAEDPYLYTLVIETAGGADVRAKRIGFKEQKVVGNTILVNGRKIKFKGVNRHETNPENGRTVSLEDMLADLRLMKRYNIDTVRTSHYPDHRLWYDLCDRYGIYLVAEANVEGHEAGYEEKGLGRLPEWERSIVERNVRQAVFYRDHPSVTIWSMGNETGHGDNFRKAIAAVREADPSRPIHWERGNRDADMDSRMYPSVEWCEERGRLGDLTAGAKRMSDKYSTEAAEQSSGKAFFMCEYAHAMGNSLGNFAEYWDVFYRYDSLTGGCIWDWVDQAVWKETDRVDPKTGRRERFLAYGGDFDEQPNDGPFCVNGVVDPFRSVTPKLVEVGHVHRNLVVTSPDAATGRAELWNRCGFLPADVFEGRWELLEDGVRVAGGQLAVPSVPPLSRAELVLPRPDVKTDPGREYFYVVSFATKAATDLVPAGWIVARDQLPYGKRPKSSLEVPRGEVATEETPDGIRVSAPRLEAVFSRRTGTLASLKFDGRAVLAESDGLVTGPRLTVARAFTDNDKWMRGPFYDSGLSQLTYHARPLRVERLDGTVKITSVVEVYGRKSAAFTHETVWTVGAGSLRADNRVTPRGTMPAALPRLGVSLRLSPELERIAWYGRGPGENYVDRCSGSFVGRYASTVAAQYVDYVRPQDCGAKTDVRWVEFADAEGRGVRFASSEPMIFQALHYSCEDLEYARHLNGQERRRTPLVPHPEVLLNLDVRQTGLGGASCGPRPMAAYLFDPNSTVEWSTKIEPARSVR